MIIQIQAGFIHIVFEEPDWRHKAGGAQMVISGIKTNIGHKTRNPDSGFEYSELTKEWTVKDTPRNRTVLEQLQEWYLIDKNQEKLFG